MRGSPRLSAVAANIIADMNEHVFVSAVSAYEIMNKYRIGKLQDYDDVAKNYLSFVKRLEVVSLPVNECHAHFAGKFEWTHRDPFDRFLAAQAFIENLTLITNDEAFVSLPWVTVLW